MSEMHPAVKYGYNPVELVKQYSYDRLQLASVAILRLGGAIYHRLEFDTETLPQNGPALINFAHFGNLDTIALKCADPYSPGTAFPIKSEYKKIPGVWHVLEDWGGIPVDRDGHDQEAVERMMAHFEQGHTVCVAPEGTRSRTGHLGPMDDAAMFLTLDAASRGIPVFPAVVVGSYEALPAGSKIPLPRPHKMKVIIGEETKFAEELDLANIDPKRKKIELFRRLSPAASMMRQAYVEMLPERYHPLPDTPLLHNKKDYVKHK